MDNPLSSEGIIQPNSTPQEPAPPPEGKIAPAPATQPEPIAPPTPVTQETIIIPSGPAEMPNPISSPEPPPAPVPEHLQPETSNQFIPQAVAPAGTPPPASVHRSNPSGRRILMIVIFLLLLVGAGVGAKFALDFVTGSKAVTLEYWGLWENDATLQSVFTEYHTKNPKITIQYSQQSPKQYRERLQAAIDRGTGPDVFRFHNTWVPMLKTNLATVPTTVMTVADFTSTFYPIAKNDLVGGSSIFGIPLMIDGLGLYYNEDLFAAAGVTPPTTWEELLNMVPKLTVKNGDTISTSAIALGTTGNIENFSDILATMMIQNGAKLTDPTGKEAEETLIFYKKFSTPSDPVYTWNDTLDNSIVAFANSRVAMMLAPSWRAFDIKQINPSLRFKIVPIPQLPGNNVTWASYWVEGVSSKSKNSLEAWKFLKYLSSREVMTKMYTEESKVRLFGEPYSRVDLASNVTSDPYVGAFIQQAPHAHSFPLSSRTFDNGLNDKLIKYLEDAVNGVGLGGAPTEVLQTASAGFRQVFGTYGLTVNSAPATSP